GLRSGAVGRWLDAHPSGEATGGELLRATSDGAHQPGRSRRDRRSDSSQRADRRRASPRGTSAPSAARRAQEPGPGPDDANPVVEPQERAAAAAQATDQPWRAPQRPDFTRRVSGHREPTGKAEDVAP